jgi:hypothetical protein
MKEIVLALTQGADLSGTDISFVGNNLGIFEAFRVSKVILSNKFYNIYDSNNRFNIREWYDNDISGPLTTRTIGWGYYTADQFAEQLSTVLNAYSIYNITYTVSVSDDGYLTISITDLPTEATHVEISSVTEVGDYKTSAFERIFGVGINEASPQVYIGVSGLRYVSANPIDLLGPQILYIKCPELFINSNNRDTITVFTPGPYDPNIDVQNSIVSVPLISPFNVQQLYEPSNPTTYYCGSRQFPNSVINFSIVDELNYPLNMNGAYCYVHLQLLRINTRESFI